MSMQHDAVRVFSSERRAPGPRQVVLERDLIRSDMGFELFALMLRHSPLAALAWLSGRLPDDAPLPFAPEALLYDQSIAGRLRQRLAEGQPVDISSALPARWKAAILAHLGLTQSSLAQSSFAQGSPAGAFAEADAAAISSEAAIAPPSGLRAYLKALRVHQWSKNLLVFVPLVMSHQFLEAQPLLHALLAFVSFGLVASSIYLLNDIMDLQQDRRHPTKRRRPFASGTLPVRHGLALLPLLLGATALIAAYLPPLFSLVMAAYLTLNLAYTFCLKRKLLVDVVALSGAYTLRILAGNAAGPIELSNWLLAFSMFVFLSLALVKRYVELDTVKGAADEQRVMGRGYRRGDLDMIAQLGVSCGVAAVVVLALFVDGAGKSGLYSHREMIWLICPIVLYVVGRIWVLAKRSELPDDPVGFMLTDWRTYALGAVVGVLFYLAV